MSPAVEHVLGLDPQYLVGWPIVDLIHPDDEITYRRLTSRPAPARTILSRQEAAESQP